MSSTVLSSCSHVGEYEETVSRRGDTIFADHRDFPPEIILMGVRWYLAYPLRTCHVVELMEEREVNVDHSTINR